MMATGPGQRLSLLAPDGDAHQDTVATFITKLWGIVEKPEYNHLIHWSEVSVQNLDLYKAHWTSHSYVTDPLNIWTPFPSPLPNHR